MSFNLGWFLLPLFMILSSIIWSSRKKGPALTFKESLAYLRIIKSPDKRNETKKDNHGLAILATLILCILASIIIAYLFSKAGMNDLQLVKNNLSNFPIYALILSFTLTPIAEELFFRGLLFKKVEEKTGSTLIGALVSSILFGLAHASYTSIVEIVATTAIGLILCWVTKKKNSLVPAIVTHACLNLIAVIPMLGL